MLLVAGVTAVVIILILNYTRKFLAYRALFNKLPGIDSFSLIYGNLHKWPGPNEEGLAFDFEQARQYVYFHRIWAGPFTPVIISYHPESIKPLLKSSAPKPTHNFLASPYDMGLKWLGKGLLLANGKRWARNRRLLTPAFHFDVLKMYMDVFNSCSQPFLKTLEAASKTQKSFDVSEPVSLFALDVILQCAFSHESNCQTDGETMYTSALQEMVKLWTDRSLKPQVFNEFVYSLTTDGKRFYKLCDIAHEVAEEIITKRKKFLESGGTSKRNDFLDTLLTARDEDDVGLTFLEIRNEVDTFLFEGHDTTTSGITWTLFCLAEHPEHQQRVYEEVCSVLGDSNKLEWNDLSSLVFTTMCIKEAMRLHCPVPFIERTLEEDMEMCGHVIPAGTDVAVQIYILHHNPHIWDHPLDFLPDRFHPDKQKLMDPFQFIPFSAGSRNCIGQNFAMNEMRLIVAKTIKQFELRANPEIKPRRFQSVTMKSENGVHIYAKLREESL